MKISEITKEELKAIEDMELDIDLDLIKALYGDEKLQEEVMEYISMSSDERSRLARMIP